MIDRRAFVRRSALLAGMLGAGSRAYAQVVDPQPPENPFGFIGPEDDPTFGQAITGAPPAASAVGAGPSRHEEVRKAFRLLYEAPRGNDHMAVARYFENITAVNADGEKYNAEWNARANPLIVGFFSMTNTTPSTGDQTHWCAAFVSFCLYAAGKANQFSALSGAYRSYSTATTNPMPGDVVVFSKPGPDGAKGFGHVGLFVGQSAGKIRVLGGNQRGNSGTTGAVIAADFPVSSSSLQLHSFRKVVS
jgi:uncharacterized protein (TIGR02594 family)